MGKREAIALHNLPLAPKLTVRQRDLYFWQSLKMIKEEKKEVCHLAVEGQASRADQIN